MSQAAPHHLPGRSCLAPLQDRVIAVAGEPSVIRASCLQPHQLSLLPWPLCQGWEPPTCGDPRSVPLTPSSLPRGWDAAVSPHAPPSPVLGPPGARNTPGMPGRAKRAQPLLQTVAFLSPSFLSLLFTTWQHLCRVPGTTADTETSEADPALLRRCSSGDATFQRSHIPAAGDLQRSPSTSQRRRKLRHPCALAPLQARTAARCFPKTPQAIPPGHGILLRCTLPGHSNPSVPTATAREGMKPL